MKSVVIIKGNPMLVDNNLRAGIFYDELKSFFESLNLTVSFDPGIEYTEPEVADVWIGHSKGADRLRFAKPETIVIGIGVPENVEGNNFIVINHPQDEMVKRTFNKGEVVESKSENILDDTHHYVLSDEMKDQIRKIISDKI